MAADFEPSGLKVPEVLRSAFSSSPVDLLAEQVSVPSVAGVLLDHVGQQPAQAHPVLGRLLQPTAGQRLGQRVAGAVHGVDPERPQASGVSSDAVLQAQSSQSLSRSSWSNGAMDWRPASRFWK